MGTLVTALNDDKIIKSVYKKFHKMLFIIPFFLVNINIVRLDNRQMLSI